MKTEIVKTDGSKADLSDATYIQIKQTYTIEEYREAVAKGELPDFQIYFLKAPPEPENQ